MEGECGVDYPEKVARSFGINRREVRTLDCLFKADFLCGFRAAVLVTLWIRDMGSTKVGGFVGCLIMAACAVTTVMPQAALLSLSTIPVLRHCAPAWGGRVLLQRATV